MKTWKFLLAAAFVGGLAQIPAHADEEQAISENTESVELNEFSNDDISLMVQDAVDASEATPTPGEHCGALPEACQQASITDAQKDQIRAAVLQSKRDTVALKSQLKLSR